MIEDFYTREYKPEGCISPQEKDRLIEFSTLAVRNVLERLNIKDKIDLASRVDNGFGVRPNQIIQKNRVCCSDVTDFFHSWYINRNTYFKYSCEVLGSRN